jgi:hypothetical protein
MIFRSDIISRTISLGILLRQLDSFSNTVIDGDIRRLVVKSCRFHCSSSPSDQLFGPDFRINNSSNSASYFGSKGVIRHYY